MHRYSIGRRRLLGTVAAGLVAAALPERHLLAQDQAQLGDDVDPVADVGPAVAGPDEFVSTGIVPVVLTLPSLGVTANVAGVGQDEDGAMSAPSNPDEIAWYSLGPGMGVPGNAVFAAHVDWGGRPRVFGQLAALQPGSPVLIVDAAGNGYQYTVESSEWFQADGAPVEEIFSQPAHPMVTLITCGGTYRAATREYLDRLVVRARGG